MKNVAILYSGFYRYLDIVLKNNVDFFNSLGYNEVYFLNCYDVKCGYAPHLNISEPLNFSINDSISKLPITFSGIRIDVLNELQEYYWNNISGQVRDSELKRHEGAFTQIYKRLLGVDLIEQHQQKFKFSFDYVILSRCDLMFKSFSCIDFLDIDNGYMYFNDVFYNDFTMIDESIIVTSLPILKQYLINCLNEFCSNKSISSNTKIPHNLQYNVLIEHNSLYKKKIILDYILRDGQKIHETKNEN